MEIRSIINSFSFSLNEDSNVEALLTKASRGPAVKDPAEPALRDRFPFLRLIHYSPSIDGNESSSPYNPLDIEDSEGIGLALNFSSHGMLVVLKGRPDVEQVFRVRIPTPIEGVHTPTLAEVRWARALSLASSDQLHLVGLKFLV